MSNRDFEAGVGYSYEIIDSEEEEKIIPRKVCRKEPSPCSIRGSEEYYIFRFNDFMERHKGCKHTPPGYYYGPLKDAEQVKKTLEKLKKKEYNIAPRFPFLFANLKITLASIYVNPTNISNGRELWIGLESELVSRLDKIEPYQHNEKEVLPYILESYGFKYCMAFGKQLRDKLTPTGQKWVDNTLVLLQEYMEQGLIKKSWKPKDNNSFIDKYKLYSEEKYTEFYTNIELNSEKFKDFAFATHPDAYLDGGLRDIPVEDLVRIVVTPDFAEWLDMSTIEQAATVGKEMVPTMGKRALNYTKEKVSLLIENVTSIFE